MTTDHINYSDIGDQPNDAVSEMGLMIARSRKVRLQALRVIVILEAVLILIVAVGFLISVKNCGRCTGDENDKMWLFAMGHYGVRAAYLDEESGEIRGYNVDVINEVCKLANKNCEIVWDQDANCWDSTPGMKPRGGDGLMNGWYDACVGWIPTKARKRTFRFTDPIFKGMKDYIYTIPNSTLELPINFDKTSYKVGFVDGWSSDEFCLAKLPGISGLDVQNDNQVAHFDTVDSLVTNVLEGKVDLAFASEHPQVNSRLRKISSGFTCGDEWGAMMLRKDSNDLAHWWNEAFGSLVGTSRYEEICTDLQIAHGHMPGRSASEVCIGE